MVRAEDVVIPILVQQACSEQPAILIGMMICLIVAKLVGESASHGIVVVMRGCVEAEDGGPPPGVRVSCELPDGAAGEPAWGVCDPESEERVCVLVERAA